LNEIQRAYPAATEIARHRPSVERMEAEAEITGLVRAYAEALSRPDRQALLAIYPAAPQDDLDTLDRKGLRTYEKRYQDIEVRLESNGVRARVQAAWFDNVVAATGKRFARSGDVTMTFEKRGSSWIRIR
jgi:hypothetical protein